MERAKAKPKPQAKAQARSPSPKPKAKATARFPSPQRPASSPASPGRLRQRTLSPGFASINFKADAAPVAQASATAVGREILSKLLVLDLKGDGCIERHELAGVMMHIDADIWTAERVDAMMSLIGQGEDGKVQCAEFVNWAFGSAEQGESETLFLRALDGLPASDSAEWRVVASAGVNVREVATTTSAVICKKPCDDYVRGRQVGEWLMLSDELGFILIENAKGALLDKRKPLSGVDAELPDGRHLIFSYGTLCRGFHNHHYMDGAEFLGDATTKSLYRMFARKPKNQHYMSLPFVAAHGHGAALDAPKMRIHGEVYAVNSEQLLGLDGLERHPTWYHREVVLVNLGGKSRPCWLYFNEEDMLNAERLVAVATGNFRDHRPGTPPPCDCC